MWEGRSHWLLGSLEALPKLNKESHSTLALFSSHFLQHNPQRGMSAKAFKIDFGIPMGCANANRCMAQLM
ncbi:hypothetical protein KSB_91980 [Ktedonobacter robiniae]|uniref:Uncharacterized protein n=1 Tax=Ktedonobacter robiniae TaxID=2778365 RepID=A0ABQ3V729_9CHLR|nr:hypothetical protein KSB_91980 [Ktedonobacter robiniae]